MNYIIDPSDVLDWKFDWTNWLQEGEAILAYVLTVSEGITLDTDSESEGVVTYWLSNCTAGNWYKVACKITTNAGRTKERTMYFHCVNQ